MKIPKLLLQASRNLNEVIIPDNNHLKYKDVIFDFSNEVATNGRTTVCLTDKQIAEALLVQRRAKEAQNETIPGNG